MFRTLRTAVQDEEILQPWGEAATFTGVQYLEDLGAVAFLSLVEDNRICYERGCATEGKVYGTLMKRRIIILHV